MTPQEQQLVSDLFDRLASLEGQRRDADAERLIGEGMRRAPNAVYALVQSVLVQDEALKRANARIEELEHGQGAAEPASGGFLDSMRNALTGHSPARGSVPSVQPRGQEARPGGQGSSGVWGPQPPPQPPPQPGLSYPPQGYAQQAYPPAGPAGMMGMHAPGFGGGSFLGTAAATAAGMVGGGLLLNGIRNMMGGGHQAFADYQQMNPNHLASPSDGGHSGAGSDLAREAGAGDIGGHPAAAQDDADQDGGQENAYGSDADDQSDDQQGGDDYDDGGYDDSGNFDGGGYDDDTV
jgi:uncharacterized protein